MEIRLLNDADDKMAVSNIYEESWKFAYRGIVPKDYLDAIPKGRWVKSLENPVGNSVIMIDNGKMIGISCFCPSRIESMYGYGEVVSVYLLPEFIFKESK